MSLNVVSLKQTFNISCKINQHSLSLCSFSYFMNVEAFSNIYVDLFLSVDDF